MFDLNFIPAVNRAESNRQRRERTVAEAAATASLVDWMINVKKLILNKQNNRNRNTYIYVGDSESVSALDNF